jgi:hypothetical protein
MERSVRMKRGGRKAGTPNKVTAEMREILQNVLAETLADDIRALTPAERLKLLRYVIATPTDKEINEYQQPIIIQVPTNL